MTEISVPRVGAYLPLEYRHCWRYPELVTSNEMVLLAVPDLLLGFVRLEIVKSMPLGLENLWLPVSVSQCEKQRLK